MFCCLRCTSRFLKTVHHDIFEVVAELCDKNFNPGFAVEKFLQEFGSKWVQQASVEPVGI